MHPNVILLILAIIIIVFQGLLRVTAAPPILASLPRFHADSDFDSKPGALPTTTIACVSVVVLDPNCDAISIGMNHSHTQNEFALAELIRFQIQAGADPRVLEHQHADNQVQITYPLVEGSVGVMQATVCTVRPVLLLACVAQGSADDALVIHTRVSQDWSAAVVVREQKCDSLVVDVATTLHTPSATPTWIHGAWIPLASTTTTTRSSSNLVSPKCFYGTSDIWAFTSNASDVQTRVLPRTLATWHTPSQLSLMSPTRTVVFTLPPPTESCNDTFYADAVDRIRRAQGLNQFRFSWKHARPNIVAFMWGSVLATYQMGLCVGVFWKHQRVFFVLTLFLMSLHIPLIGHIQFDAYIVATTCALLLPFVVGPVIMVAWFCTQSVRDFKLPERRVADNLFLCFLTILLHGMFLLVSLTQDTS